MAGKLYILAAMFLFTWMGTQVHGQTVNGRDRSADHPKPDYRWTKLTDSAAFPRSYNFSLFTFKDKLWAFHPAGVWSSVDGKDWKKSPLPNILNNAFLSYVLFKDAVYALGTFEGNIEKHTQTTRIARTTKLDYWNVLTEHSNIPQRMFCKYVTYKDTMWLFGGYDGTNYYNDVWSSVDGVHWKRVIENCPWSKRNVAAVVIFKDKMYLMGGGVINGESQSDVWYSEDGKHWMIATNNMADTLFWGYSAVVYDDRIWLLGTNRNGPFRSEIISSADGIHWTPEHAPWTPRGGVAATVFHDKVIMTGGKYSEGEGSHLRFIYSNDVWSLGKK